MADHKNTLPKKYIIILTVSLLLNILFLGMHAGHVLHRPHPGPFMDGPGGPGPHQKDFFASPEFKQHHQTMEMLKEKMKQALLQDPYNPQVAKQAFLDFHNQMNQFRWHMFEKILEKAAALSPEERMRLLPPEKGEFSKGPRDHKGPKGPKPAEQMN